MNAHSPHGRVPQGRARSAVCPDTSAQVHLLLTRGEPASLTLTASRAHGRKRADYRGSDWRLCGFSGMDGR